MHDEFKIVFFTPRTANDYFVADVYRLDNPESFSNKHHWTRFYCGVAKFGSTKCDAMREAYDAIQSALISSRKVESVNP